MNRIVNRFEAVKDTGIGNHVVADLIVVFLHGQHLVCSLSLIDQVEIKLGRNLRALALGIGVPVCRVSERCLPVGPWEFPLPTLAGTVNLCRITYKESLARGGLERVREQRIGYCFSDRAFAIRKLDFDGLPLHSPCCIQSKPWGAW